MTKLSEQQYQVVARSVSDKKALPGALLPILHDIQDQLGYIPKAAIDIIAAGLNQTAAEIYGVISFYHHFRLDKPGNHLVEICRAEACQAMGSEALEQEIKSKLGIDYHQTTKDNNVSLEPVYCLGNCACGPSVKVGERVYGRMSGEKFSQLMDKLSTYVVELGQGENHVR
ncbi:formate dehydrogenase subunit gamma [Thalassomonas actiniarum]|uniref:NADH-quinone oxidoreductase subunit E n=1 Tax=Thalassomonas actiniarum TaxID=485447 RepID=A0AAE9YTX7_9GAMM|nr:formate dehydrogenase subunit gamma [Thalassomonas actiniarum]WDD99437.1 formate dehydrogenase subunit gamma [Thalassomonas actiniarum]